MPVANDPVVDPPRSIQVAGPEGPGPEERPMIGDFNESADDLWTLFGTEVKSHDDAQIEIVKDKMNNALVFVRSISVLGCTTCGIADLDSLISGLTGWLIFWCPHSVPNQ